MKTVAELRALVSTGPKTGPNGWETFNTNTGIFSTHFASEKILRNVVSDSTIDVMHIFLCGISRYLFSWLTDILIPTQFSWASLNERKRAYKYVALFKLLHPSTPHSPPVLQVPTRPQSA